MTSGCAKRSISQSAALAVGLAFVSVVPVSADDGTALSIANRSGEASQIYPGDAYSSAESRGSGARNPDTPELDPVDLAALYYYAKQRQTNRVAAEIQRLQIIHPGFRPPSDIYLPESERQPDEKALWKLFEASDFAAIDAEIIRHKADDPDWQPSADFSTKLERKKRRAAITAASEKKDWMAVLAAAGNIDPATDADFDLVWFMSDAHAALANAADAAWLLKALAMRQGQDRLSDEHLITTLQKYLAVTTPQDVRALMGDVGTTSFGPAVHAALALDLARAEIGHFNAIEGAAPVAPAQLALVESHASSANSPSDLALLGWYHLKQKEPAQAEPRFVTALAIKPDPNTAKGAYLALQRQGKDEEAGTFAVSHLADLRGDPVFLMNVVSSYLDEAADKPVSEAAITAYSDAIMHTRAADHAEILAWYAYNSRQYDAAEAWFRQAYEWEDKEDRIKGLALTFLRQDKTKSFRALKAEFADYYPDIWPEIAVATVPGKRIAAPVSSPSKATSASYVRHFEAKDYASCLAAIDKLGAAARQPNVRLIAGWCHLGLGRIGEARSAFEQAMQGSGDIRSDAVYGNALTLLRARLTDEAESLIAAYPVNARRDRELRAEIYFQRARSAFDHKQYQRVIQALDARAALVAEPLDLAQLRGWAYYHLGQGKRAQAVFGQLDMHIREAGVTGFINTAEPLR